MPIELVARTRLPGAPRARARLRGAAGVLLAELGQADAELALTLVDDDEMAALNARYRGLDKPTDVLSFSQLEGEALAGEGSGRHLGDVVISVPTAERQAAAGSWTLEEELLRLLVHGVLHLLGYDHEKSRREAERMFAEECRLFDRLAAGGYSCARGEPS